MTIGTPPNTRKTDDIVWLAQTEVRFHRERKLPAATSSSCMGYFVLIAPRVLKWRDGDSPTPQNGPWRHIAHFNPLVMPGRRIIISQNSRHARGRNSTTRPCKFAV